MELSEEIESGLDEAWNRKVAENSMERWLQLCEAEGWGRIPQDMTTLARIFGASWYFTRFIFVNGKEIADLIDSTPPQDISTETILDEFEEILTVDGLEAQLERLRVLKNAFMLQILIGYLRRQFSQEHTEHCLTCLAEAVIRIIIQVFELAPEQADTPVKILGMGRMAGYEMTFGSDLDLIFLYAGSSDNVDAATEQRIRLLLRHIAMQTPNGSLYDVDMRLRPHGNAGVLITTFQSFIDYHSDDRDIWERQMMTRCRPVTHVDERLQELMASLESHVYGVYDVEYLKREIANMRRRVEKELGRPAGKYEVKRGRGGLMDIDFITHFFQLAQGYEYQELRTASTREALHVIDKFGMLDSNTCALLQESYDFLKRVEMSLRLFDMKPISAFYSEAEANTVLSRAMGFGQQGPETFVERYRSVTNNVREIFKSIMDG